LIKTCALISSSLFCGVELVTFSLAVKTQCQSNIGFNQPIIELISRNAETGVHYGGTAPLPFERGDNSGIGALT